MLHVSASAYPRSGMDSPLDIDAGIRAGCKTIGVGTGSYSVEELPARAQHARFRISSNVLTIRHRNGSLRAKPLLELDSKSISCAGIRAAICQIPLLYSKNGLLRSKSICCVAI